MGVDVSPVAGFTVTFPGSTLAALINAHDCDHAEDLFEKFKLSYSYVGSSYELYGPHIVLLLMPKTAKQVDKQIQSWLNGVNTALKTQFTVEDVSFISETFWH